MRNSNYPWEVADALYEELKDRTFKKIKKWGIDFKGGTKCFIGGNLKLGEIIDKIPGEFEVVLRNRIFADKAVVLASYGTIADEVILKIDTRSANELSELVQLISNFMAHEMEFALPARSKYCNKLSSDLESSRKKALKDLPPASLIERARATLPARQTRFDQIKVWFFNHKYFSWLIIIVIVLTALLSIVPKILDLWHQF